jgi:PAS domain S-box-containing protein
MASRAAKVTEQELNELRERADMLAEEAERLRLVDDLSAGLGHAQGLQDLAVELARLTLEATKGSNAVAYCRTDDHFRVATAAGNTHEAQAIDDEMVSAVFRSGEAAELPSMSDDAALMTWAIPLSWAERTVGVLVAENTRLPAHDAEERFGSFLRYAALLLHDGVRDQEELSRANDGLRATTERLTSEAAQREEAEEQLRKTARDLEDTVALRTRAFRTLSRVSETLMRAYDERELLQNVCDTVVDVGGYVLCWVGFVEHDDAKTVRPVASAGRDADYVDHIAVTWGREPSGRGPTGRSIRRRKPVAARDLGADFNFGPWRNEAVSRGYQSSASFPLADSRGEVFGAIAIYSAKAGAFDSDEMQLLSELAGDLAFGIGALRERRARAEADKRVRESARYARGLVEVNDSPLALIDPSGKISDVNRATEEATGLPRDQLIGTDFADYFTDSDAARAVYQRVLAEGIVRDFPLNLKHAAGSVMDVEYNATVYRDDGGELRGVFAAARDVTERKRAERERSARLRFIESMDRVNRAIQGSDDLDQMMRDVLDIVRTLFDSDRAFLLYPCDPDVDTWGVPMESTSPEYPGAMGLGVSVTDEFARLQRDLLGTTAPVRFGGDTGNPIPQDVAKRFGIKSLMSIAVRPKIGRPWQFGVQQCSHLREWTDEEASLLQEIARRLEDALSTGLARRELELSEAEYRRLVETAREGICQLDADAVITFVNARMAEMLGYSADELVGQSFAHFMAEEEFPDHLVRMQNRHQGMSEDYDRRFRHKDGRIVWTRVSASPVFDETGEFIGSFGMLTDVTEAKRAEAERADRLRFVESMDRVNRAIQGTNDLNQMMSDTLDEVLSIFGCDRAFLLYPCDPDSSTWAVPMERSRPEYPGVGAQSHPMPMDPKVAATLQSLLDADGPVRFGPGTDHPLGEDALERFGFLSFMSVALYPKTGKPWQFGLHQCSYAREWTDEEVKLQREVARRLEDALSTLLAHRDLQRSEHEYRRLIETASEGVWVFGPDSTTTFANPRLAEMMGYSADELIGRSVTDFLFEEDVPEHENRIARRREGLSEHFELRLRAKDGSVVWASVSAASIIDDAGQYAGSFGMVTDITERKLVEEARRASDREYWTLLQSIAGAVVVHGADTRILIANEAAKRLLGFSAEELLGKSIQDAAWEFVREDGTRMPPEEYPAARVAANGQALEDHVVGLRRPGDETGAVTWSLVSAGPVFGVRGELVQIIVTFIDITPRIHAQEALMDSEAKYREVFDNVSDALTVFDVTEDGRFRFAGINPTAERIRGIPQAEAYGRYYEEVVDYEQVARSLPNFRRCVEMAAPLAYEEWHTGGGQDWYLETVLLPVLDSSGRATRLIMLGHDITRRKRAEDVRTAKRAGVRSKRGES